MTSSGSLASANGVKPRRSQKTTTISRRWLSRNDSSPESTISSASCGDRNGAAGRSARARPTCACTRSSSSRFQAASSAACRVIGVVVPLDPRQRGDPGQQLAAVDRLGQEVVGPRLEGLDLLLVAAGGDHHDRQERRGRVRADPPAHLVAVHARHHDVEQDEVDAALGQRGERLLTGLRAADVVAARGQHRLEQPDVRRLVVDDEHRVVLGRIRHGRPPRSRNSRTCSGSARTLIGFSR